MKISELCAVHVRRWAHVGEPDACWLYRRKSFITSPGGEHIYGRVYFGGQRQRAHRVVAALCGADIAGKSVCHTCDTPLCLNPAHLFVGTAADNMADKMQKGRHVAPKGAQQGQAKLTNTQAAEIRRRALAGESPRCLATEFKIDRSRVSRIKCGAAYAA